MKVRVECYAGSKAEERPVRFNLEEHDYFVEEVLDQWYGPDDAYFKVRADESAIFTSCGAQLPSQEADGVWSPSGRADRKRVALG